MATATYYRGSPMFTRSQSSMSTRSDSRGGLPRIGDKTVYKRTSISSARAEVPHAKNVYNPARKQICARYSHSDWAATNAANYSLSHRERDHAERVQGDVYRTVKAVDQETRNQLANAAKRLKERVSEIQFWMGELDNEMRLNAAETEALQETLRTLESSLSRSYHPLKISEECLMQREKRVGVDQCQDEVEMQLIREVEFIRKCQRRMKKLIEKCRIQLNMNRAAHHELDKDLKDKSLARNIDDRNFQMNIYSPGLGYFPGIENYDNTISIPDSWVRFTQDNIRRSQKCRTASAHLRDEIDNFLRQVANDMMTQFNTVNNAFDTRILETSDTRTRLQSNLQQTLQKMYDIEQTIAQLRKAIADKDGPLKLAQTRLDERTRRYNVELCNDPVMRTLQREVRRLQDIIYDLNRRLKEAECSHARLAKTRAVLENEIAVKENSLSLDQQVCMGMRRVLPSDPVGSIFNMAINVY